MTAASAVTRLDLLRCLGMVVALILHAEGGHSTSSFDSSNSGCRCLTGQSCFPSADELSYFNNSLVGGRLILPRPTAWPCYQPHFNADSCTAVENNFTDGFFRASNAGSMQSWNFEDDGEKRCPLETAKDSHAQCDQGRVPVYGVQAESVSDIQETIRFAANHNLRLFVKSTGHDYLGRSAAPGSFLLWMHKYRHINVSMSFVPTGCSSSYPPKPVITVGGGPQWAEVYTRVSVDTNDKYVLVGGMCPTVGGAGGFVMSGGHSPMGPTFGLAVDHVLQFQLVTADGKVHTINECQDPDLFWAMKGGGPGTFGVMTSVTYQLQPSPTFFTGMKIFAAPALNGTLLTPQQIKDIFRAFARQVHIFDENRVGGYIEINPLIGLDARMLILASEADAKQIAAGFAAGFAELVQQGVLKISTQFNSFDTFFAWKASDPSPAVEIQGGRFEIGTRLIPLSALDHPEKLGEALAQAAAGVDDFILYMVAGRGVRERDDGGEKVSTTPAWRRAVFNAEVINAWSFNTSDQGIAEKVAGIQAGLDILRKAYPDSGTYFAEANLEPDFQQALWGKNNYERLLKIKARVDPDDLFMCKQCVGSEKWDASGNCRQRHSY
ncbi:putative FAD-linked oxidoreductase [Hypsibius exemplaris]|uniref:FAD-linked oxidoreductase n=1 Tax=Hypsibius exemplaris TaxID=2072580 RepID=A0A1W0X5A0_HYPEX|nr:putative FAD-linked oxidoreductase [Hypsibius exemplaris]